MNTAPEGLFGELMMTPCVFGVSAARRASASGWKVGGFGGIALKRAPATVENTLYSAKYGAKVRNSVSGPRVSALQTEVSASAAPTDM